MTLRNLYLRVLGGAGAERAAEESGAVPDTLVASLAVSQLRSELLQADRAHEANVQAAEAQIALTAWEWDQGITDARARPPAIEDARLRAIGEAIHDWKAAEADNHRCIRESCIPD